MRWTPAHTVACSRDTRHSCTLRHQRVGELEEQQRLKGRIGVCGVCARVCGCNGAATRAWPGGVPTGTCMGKWQQRAHVHPCNLAWRTAPIYNVRCQRSRAASSHLCEHARTLLTGSLRWQPFGGSRKAGRWRPGGGGGAAAPTPCMRPSTEVATWTGGVQPLNTTVGRIRFKQDSALVVFNHGKSAKACVGGLGPTKLRPPWHLHRTRLLGAAIGVAVTLSTLITPVANLA